MPRTSDPPPFRNLGRSFPRRDPGWAHLGSTLPAPLMLEVTYGPTADGWLAASVSRVRRRTVAGPAGHYAEPATFDQVAATLAAIT